MGSRRKEEKAFQSSLRKKLNMPEPEAAAQEAWTSLEEAVVAIKGASDVLLEASTGSPEVEQAVGDGVAQLADGLEAVVSSLEAMETLLVKAGVLEDDELLEDDVPADHGPDA